jgi:hypothetical protein
MTLQPLQTQASTRGTKPALDWLFVAFFANGDTIKQTQEDKSATEPNRSAHYDVRMRNEDKHDLVAFELHHIDGDKIVTVDLTTGAFMANGIPMHLHNQNFEPDKYPLELVYFKETRVDQDIKAIVQDDMTVKEERIGQPRHYINRYFIGWKTQVNGKSKQVTMAVG